MKTQRELAHEIDGKDGLLNRSKSYYMKREATRFQSAVVYICIFLLGILFLLATWGVFNPPTAEDMAAYYEYQYGEIETVEASTEVATTEMVEDTTSTTKDDPGASGEATEYSYVAHGQASTYGWGEKLNPKTSCGQDFNPSVVAIAVPRVLTDKSVCGKVAEVTYNGNTILAEIWDGGPNPNLHRIADLTRGAAEALGIMSPTVFTIDIKWR